MRLFAIVVCVFLLTLLVGCAEAPKRFLTAEQDAVVAELCGPPAGCWIMQKPPAPPTPPGPQI